MLRRFRLSLLSRGRSGSTASSAVGHVGERVEDSTGGGSPAATSLCYAPIPVATNALEPTRVETSRGTYAVTWGVNKWVLIDGGGVSMQRQVESQRDFARLLADTGLPVSEADTHAASVWRSRPSDAGIGGVRSEDPFDETSWGSWRAMTGLPSWVLLLLTVIVFLVVVILLVLAR